MGISFNAIPVDLRTPGQYIEFDNTQALRGLPVMPNRILVIGASLSTGSVGEAVPVRIFKAEDAEGYFGKSSMLANMVAIAKKNNPYTEMWAAGLFEPSGGTKAVGSMKFDAAGVAVGTQKVYVCGTLVEVATTAGMPGSAVATALVAACGNFPTLPVVAAVDGVDNTKVNFTAVHKGADAGTGLDLRTKYFPEDADVAGLTITIVKIGVGTAGAGSPSAAMGAIVTAIGDQWFNHIINGFTDSASRLVLRNELNRRWGPMIMREGHVWMGSVGSVGTLATFGLTENTEQFSTIGALNPLNPPWMWAAALGAQAAYYLNIDPARPLQTLPLLGILPPAIGDRFTQTDRNTLLRDGISTWKVNASGQVEIERAITMYRLNSQSDPDISYLDVETIATLAYLRYSTRTRIAAKFPRYKLASDGIKVGAGQAIVTPKIIRSELIALAREWEEVGLVENIDQFMDQLLVERDGTDPNRVNALIPPDIVNQFRVFAAKIQFIL